ncbi:NAD(P)-binding protein [Ascodesmis nigricans]|uniref:NAD(P)-binding protein n=1 Tax=Ascodesmis nigricans TaxID=341454 RepID=A0A4S2N3J6_9PEZI|nr:NAD(P)-binding protein [Ascodesmis nigricans]
MPPKIFLIGATGYVGGTILHTLITAHPDYLITVLVRTSEASALISQTYPSVTPVIGTLDATDILTQAATGVDIVINAAHSDHTFALHTLLTISPRFLLHTSGAAILPSTTDPSTFGLPPTTTFSDITSLPHILSLPSTHLHQPTESLIASAPTFSVRSAIICPPCIYGRGLGPGNTKSVQIPEVVKTTLKLKHGFVVGEGKAQWSVVHVRDLARVYLALVEAAVEGGGGADWFDGQGGEGYYFAENGSVGWREVVEKVGKVGRRLGVLEEGEGEVERWEVEEVNEKVNPYGGVLWGTNALCKADRARKVLGWEPKEVGWEETLEEEIRDAVNALKLEGN